MDIKKKRTDFEARLPRRLPIGKMVCGPEYYGCCNTGHMPVLMHSARLENFCMQGFRFAVGDELYIADAMNAILFPKAGKPKTSVWKTKYATVRFFKTYKAAKKYFLDRCETIWEFSARVKAEEARELGGQMI